MSVIANINRLVGVVPPSQSKTTQQLIAYEPKALLWLGFKPQRARARYNKMEVLNINDQLAERLNAPPSYDPPSYEESCLPPHDKKSEMIGEK
jgi:hypothetical protein